MLRIVTAAIVAIVLACGWGARADSVPETNKSIVVQFYTMAFVEHRPAEAARLYLGKVYVQHNPRVPDGPAVFAGFFEKYFAENPAASSTIKRVIAEDDLVVIHSHSKKTETDRGMAIVDVFRVADGKIVEHWDVMQSVPETAANPNTMF